VLFAPSFNIGPNVFPLSELILRTGSLLVAFLSHQVTNTLLPDAAMFASTESALGELLKLILSLNVVPLSVDALNITSPFLLVDSAIFD
jgi:hypothetical protein